MSLSGLTHALTQLFTPTILDHSASVTLISRGSDSIGSHVTAAYRSQKSVQPSGDAAFSPVGSKLDAVAARSKAYDGTAKPKAAIAAIAAIDVRRLTSKVAKPAHGSFGSKISRNSSSPRSRHNRLKRAFVHLMDHINVLETIFAAVGRSVFCSNAKKFYRHKAELPQLE